MDDMSKYLSSLNESSEFRDQVQSKNSALQSQADSFNSKLREVHSQVEGLTAPAGIGGIAKGVSKIGRGTFQRAGFGEAYDDYSAEGVAGLARGVTNRGIAGKMDELLQRGAARVTAAKAGEPLEEDGVFDTKTGLTADESSQLDDLVSQSGKAAAPVADDAEPAAAAAAEPEAAAAADGIETATTEGTLATTTAASTADDWNPIGIVTTIGLGLATLFAGIFGHHKEMAARHVQTMGINPSTQFGV